MWVRNAWYVAAWCDELGSDAILARTIVNQPLVLYRKGDGAVVALEDRCCHRLAPLSKGRLEGDALRCMYHGLKFAADGRCIEIPGQQAIPPAARVRTYPAAERGSWIWLWMGDPVQADPGLIPETVSARDPGFRMRRGWLDYEADSELINDNLLDLSHLSYAHEKTLGVGTPQWAEERPRIVRLERGLRVQRWIENKQPPRHLRRHGEVLDMWNSYDFLVPGIFVLRSMWYPAGTAQRLGMAPPSEAPLFLRVDDQAVTAMTDRSARYFYAAGARAQDLAWEQVEKLFKQTEQAFHEDKVIIEAQQKVIDLEPGRAMVPMSFDAGPIQYRRILRQLAEREAAPAPVAAIQV